MYIVASANTLREYVNGQKDIEEFFDTEQAIKYAKKLEDSMYVVVYSDHHVLYRGKRNKEMK